jgi:D-cysteine desulfhydrase
MDRSQLMCSVGRFPRARLAHLPTPLQASQRLFEDVGRFFIKRDDLTGLGLGGNKVRHLEYRLAHALELGCDTFVYLGTANAACVTAAACARFGMGCVIAVGNEREAVGLGNMLLIRLFGARVVVLELDERSDVDARLLALEEEIAREGHRPYLAQSYLWFHVSAVVAYLGAALELDAQLRELGREAAHIYTVTGHSQAGLVLAAKLLGLPWTVTGVGVGHGFEADLPLRAWADATAELLDLPASISADDIEVTLEFAGRYHCPTPASLSAVRMAAQREGLVVDPLYTGKCLAALLDAHRSGRLSNADTVVFLHTGGTPILFEHGASFLEAP